MPLDWIMPKPTSRSCRLCVHGSWCLPLLWPFNLHDVFAGCLEATEAGKQLAPRMWLIIELLPDLPTESVCAAVAEHEIRVQQGVYEDLVATQAKYGQYELAIRHDPQLREQWLRIKGAFPVDAYRDHKGMIRRRMGAERNLRSSFSVNPKSGDDLFHAAFDVFCLRWNLYGVQHEDPLLLKLAVNITPDGTNIQIPTYWSFDPKRDIRWDAVTRLHRVRVPRRQGTVLTEGFAARLKAAETLHDLDKEALRLGLKGEKKQEFLCTGLGWVPGTARGASADYARNPKAGSPEQW
jgi:hypothetical protein